MFEVAGEYVENQLCEMAVLSSKSKGREKDEPDCYIRTPFQRDCDRIIHSKSFRRLMHKTQVFIAPEGDHFRTRLTHTLEVSRIARTMARSLRLNEDLTEAISLAHDLGHTPFGHAGERALNSLNSSGFKHNLQSLRVVDKLENSGRGLNLTFEVRDGIKNHTGSGRAETLEGNMVMIADRIAYINHDIDDAIRADIISKEDIPAELIEMLGNSHAKRINTMVESVISGGVNGGIKFSGAVGEYINALRDFMFERVYRSKIAMAEEEKIHRMLGLVYKHFQQNPKLLPSEYLSFVDEDGIDNVVCDYIAGMTDRYVLAVFDSIFVPRVWAVGAK